MFLLRISHGELLIFLGGDCFTFDRKHEFAKALAAIRDEIKSDNFVKS